MNLEDKVFLVTGGSRGLGKAIVEKLCEKGAKVGFTCLHNLAKAESLAASINQKGKGEAVAFQTDVADPSSAAPLMKAVVAHFGKLDGIVNNAGITLDRPFFKMSDQDWAQVISTNLNGVFYTSKAYLQNAIRTGRGKIVNMSSVSGLRGMKGQANYSASKGGLMALTRTLAIEYAPFNIQVNALAPGYIETEMFEHMEEPVKQKLKQNIPLKRLGSPQEIANLTAFLLSDDCNYLTGQTIAVDGGITC